MNNNRYMLSDDGIYVWDTVNRIIVAATFKQDHWIYIEGKLKWYDSPQEWNLAIKEYLGINFSDLSIIPTSEIKKILNYKEDLICQ